MTTITDPNQTTFTPKHEYFYQHYRELPPKKRNINQLHQHMHTIQQQLQKENKQLPYKIPTKDTLLKWCKQDKWEERLYTELTQEKYGNIDYEALETTREFMKLDAKVDKQHYYLLDDVQTTALNHLQQTLNNNTPEQVKITQTWTQLASQLMQVKKGLTSDYAETYSIVKFLRSQNNLTTEEQNILREVGNMLGIDQE